MSKLHSDQCHKWNVDTLLTFWRTTLLSKPSKIMDETCLCFSHQSFYSLRFWWCSIGCIETFLCGWSLFIQGSWSSWHSIATWANSSITNRWIVFWCCSRFSWAWTRYLNEKKKLISANKVLKKQKSFLSYSRWSQLVLVEPMLVFDFVQPNGLCFLLLMQNQWCFVA